MNDFLERMGLHAEGLDDNDIAAFDGTKDDLMHIAATVQAIWPRINRVAPVLMRLAVKIIAHQKENGQ